MDALDLSYGRLTDWQGRLLTSKLSSSIETREEILLRSNTFVKHQRDVVFLELKKAVSLRVLDMGRMGLNDWDVGAFTEVLRCMPLLESLHLDHNKVEAPGAEMLGLAFPENPKLRTLVLSENSLHAQGVRAIARGIAKSQVENLKLNGCCAKTGGAKALAALLRLKTCPLRSLHLESNAIGNPGGKALATAMHTLRDFNVASNFLGDDFLRLFSRVLGASKTLEKVNLSSNHFSARGLLLLAHGVRRSKTLTHLDYAYMPADDDACIAFAGALAESKSMQELNIWCPGVHNRGALAVARAVAQMPSVLSLRLWTSRLSIETMKAFANAIEQSSSIVNLEFQDFHVTRPAAEAIIRAVEFSARRVHVQMSGFRRMMEHAKGRRINRLPVLAMIVGAAPTLRRFLDKDGDSRIMSSVVRWLGVC